MAAQYQFAFSSEIVGAAIFAGGPYFCAQGNVFLALSACSKDPGLISLTVLEEEAAVFAASMTIDPLADLSNHRVYLFSGRNDQTVYPGVVQKLEQMYRDFGISAITTNYTSAAGHGFPTINYGNPCGTTRSPYITACGFDGAGQALQAIYGPLNRPVQWIPKNLRSMGTKQFTPGGVSPSILSMDDTMYYYMPTNCRGNCPVHVALHGCQQTQADIGLEFVNNTGYNNWAEANNIIILYPFIVKSRLIPVNPEGCWDWWGYDSLLNTYVTKEAPQLYTINAMIRHFKNAIL